MSDLLDPLGLAQDLIRRPSVTPEDAGALAVLEESLTALGFTCHRLRFSDVDTPDIDNLYARLGTEGPNLCFAGHTDVVPTGDGWTVDPFGAEVRDGVLYGRGAADMKGAIAAFTAAVARRLADAPLPGSISFLITGDEEGPAVNGTRKVLDWLTERGETLDACIVGEPTNPRTLGDMMKIGRRGSVTGYLTAWGTQGHVAYPHLADNPLPRMVAMLSELNNLHLDDGTEWFQPSNLVITEIDIANRAHNVIPAKAKARISIRFNDRHSGASLSKQVVEIAQRHGGSARPVISGEPFLTPPGRFSQIIADAVKAETGLDPEASTSGGTSDARFLRAVCPVIEFGLCNATMHKRDEAVVVADLDTLSRIYARVARAALAA